MAESTKVPLPEPSAWQVRRNDYGLWASQYWEECSEWEAKNCVAAADLRQLYTADQMHAHAAAVSAAKDAEIAGLRAELIKSLADNAPLRERVRVLEDAHPEPDCRTCKRSAIQHGVTRCTSPYFCTNADHYEPLPPVRLWRTAT